MEIGVMEYYYNWMNSGGVAGKFTAGIEAQKLMFKYFSKVYIHTLHSSHFARVPKHRFFSLQNVIIIRESQFPLKH